MSGVTITIQGTNGADAAVQMQAFLQTAALIMLQNKTVAAPKKEDIQRVDVPGPQQADTKNAEPQQVEETKTAAPPASAAGEVLSTPLAEEPKKGRGKKKAEEPAPAAAAPGAKTITREEFKTACMGYISKHGEKKIGEKIGEQFTAVLKSYDAVKASEVPDEKFPEFAGKVLALYEGADKELSKEAPAEDKPVTREDIKAITVRLHQLKGDEGLVPVQAVFNKYGAKDRSTLKDEDVPKVYAELKALAQ